MKEQLNELSTSSMLDTMCPKLRIFTNVCLAIPVATASVERKNTIEKSSPGRTILSHLMNISMESPETLSDEELDLTIIYERN